MNSPSAAALLHPLLHQRVQASFERQGMMLQLGARLLEVGPGLCVVALSFGERVTQQQGSFHGGAMGALADIAGGYAALTVAPEDAEVTTVEYKINFLASLRGGELQATGRVVRAGRRIIVTSAMVVHIDDSGKFTDCAVMQQTLVPVARTY